MEPRAGYSKTMVAYQSRSMVVKGKGKAVEEDNDCSTQDELDDLDENLAILSKRFSNYKFKRSKSFSKPAE